jgi:AcrR family transcriptional regulator
MTTSPSIPDAPPSEENDRRDALLDAAAGLFAAHGYAQTSVSRIAKQAGIAKATFYHHFESKSDLLDALVRRFVAEIPSIVAPVVDDASLDALTKLRRFFEALNAWKVTRRGLMLQLGAALNDDANVLLADRLRRASFDAFSPWLERVVAQGVAEGCFDVAHPGHATRFIEALLQALRGPVMRILEAPDASSEAELVGLYRAQAEAIERVLGAPPGSVELVDRATLHTWVEAALARRSSC